MNGVSGTQQTERPVFGTMSVLIPAGMHVVAHVLDANPHLGDGLNGYAGMFLGLFLMLGVVAGGLAGVALGIAAWLRRERYRFLGDMGFALCLVLLFSLR